MGYSPKQIKAIKHQMKNGKLKVKTITVSDLTFEDLKEEMFQAALIDCLDFIGIKQDIHEFMADANAGDEEKMKIAQHVANKVFKVIEDIGLKDGDIEKIKFVNKDAYDSPEQFMREEGLIK